MKNILLPLILLFTFKAEAFTLASSNPPRYGEEVKLTVGTDTCSALGLTPETLLDLVEEAMNDFWNSVPTAKIKFVRGGVGTFSANGETSLSNFLTNSGVTNEIIIGCNNDLTAFGSGTIGQGGFRYGGSIGIQGAFIIYDDSSVAGLSKKAKKALIAHEMGHAFGLGHSNFKPALMYYTINYNMDSLSRDDEDAITYLYPNTKKVGGCGTIEDIANSDSGDSKKGLPFILLLIAGVVTSRYYARKSFF
jgi:hypothetical protein